MGALLFDETSRGRVGNTQVTSARIVVHTVCIVFATQGDRRVGALSKGALIISTIVPVVAVLVQLAAQRVAVYALVVLTRVERARASIIALLIHHATLLLECFDTGAVYALHTVPWIRCGTIRVEGTAAGLAGVQARVSRSALVDRANVVVLALIVNEAARARTGTLVIDALVGRTTIIIVTL